MYEQLVFEIEGVTPTILHNGQTANPINKYAKAMKEISAKKKKTDSDYEALARIEWEAGFYFTDKMEPCWPGENIERMLLDAAKKDREGPLCKTGVMVDGNFPIIYDGPRDLPGLWADENFRIVSKCKVQQSSIMRTRPCFRIWSMSITVSYLKDVLNKSQVQRYMQTAGQLIGLSDWRPKHGRFAVNSVK